MNKYKIEAIEKSLADAQSNVAELKAQLVEAEKVGDSCSEWLLSESPDFIMDSIGVIYSNPNAPNHEARGRAFDTEEQAKQLDNNQLLYMRIVRAIAAENKKVGYVAKFDGLQLNYSLRLNLDGSIGCYAWTASRYSPVHCYMHQSVAPIIREQFSDEELTTFITKGMLL